MDNQRWRPISDEPNGNTPRRTQKPNEDARHSKANGETNSETHGETHGETQGETHGETNGETNGDLLDAYSRAVIGVVESVSPALLKLDVRDEEGRSSGGSGFLISPDGLALTNSHVAGGRTSLSATTVDGDRINAKLLGDDPSTDLALLQVAAKDMPYAELGDSQTLRVGQLVVAMGHPLGMQATVTTGVVGALGNAMRGQDGRRIENTIQHAAPINPGNSGGPLVDSACRVVGVNTAIIPWANGMGFAVPANTASWVVSQVLKHGRVQRKQLGIAAQTVWVPRREILELDLLTEQVVEVQEILTDGAAFRAGVRIADWIVAVNDRIVTNIDDLHRLLSLIPDQSIELTIVRGGRIQPLSVEFA